MVGSMTTGNTRPGWRSQAASGVMDSRSVRAAASQDIRWDTWVVHTFPYGDQASLAALVMNGAGKISAGGPPTPARDKTIWPLRRCHGTSPPPSLIVYANEAGAA